MTKLISLDSVRFRIVPPIEITASKAGYQTAIYEKYVNIKLDFFEEYSLLIFGIILIIGLSCGILIGILISNKKHVKNKIIKDKNKIIENKKVQKKEIKESNTIEKSKRDIHEDIDKLLKSIEKK